MTRDELNKKFHDGLSKWAKSRSDLGDVVGPNLIREVFEAATQGLCDDDVGLIRSYGTLEQRLHSVEEVISSLGRALR